MTTDLTCAEQIEAIKLLNRLASLVYYMTMDSDSSIHKTAREISIAAGKLSERFYQ